MHRYYDFFFVPSFTFLNYSETCVRQPPLKSTLVVSMVALLHRFYWNTIMFAVILMGNKTHFQGR